jgi:hypothetical protein
MMSPELQRLMARQNRVITIIWAAFMIAPLLYANIAYRVVIVGSQAGTNTMPGIVPYAIVVVGLVGSIVTFLLSQNLRGRALRGESIGQTTPPPAAPQVVLGPDERYVVERTQAYQVVMIVRWAGFEALAVYGLVITIMTRFFPSVVIGGVIAISLILINRPQLTEFLQDCQQYRQGHYQK